MNKYTNARIEDGKVYGISVKNGFTVALPGGDNPQITPNVSFDGMSLDAMMTLVWDAFKVKARPALKKLTSDEMKASFDGKDVKYYDMLNTSQVQEVVTFDAMSDEDKQAHIKALQKRAGLV
jgi:hypothetical protein